MTEYGGLKDAPHTIRAKITHIEHLSVTKEIRSRYRYLSHLPLTCQFGLCELNLQPPVISKSTLRQFQEELKKHQQKRAKKKQDERRRGHSKEFTLSRRDFMRLSTGSPSELPPEQFHDFLSLASSPPLSMTIPQQVSPDTSPKESQTPQPDGDGSSESVTEVSLEDPSLQNVSFAAALKCQQNGFSSSVACKTDKSNKECNSINFKLWEC